MAGRPPRMDVVGDGDDEDGDGDAGDDDSREDVFLTAAQGGRSCASGA